MAFDWARAFEIEREHLFAVAYRMLGSSSEAEDVLQDAFLRVQGTEEVPRSPRAMLTTVVVRLCLDALKSARARREAYVGPWLPEPIAASISARDDSPDLSPEGAFGKAESLSMGLLVVLEALSPLERAAFLLREAFDYDFVEIGEALGRSEAACRQLHHRARKHVEERHVRYTPSPDDALRLVTAFMTAVATGDTAGVTGLLTEDAVSITDGGGVVSAARKPILGPQRVAAFFVGLAKKGGGSGEMSAELAEINGRLALLLRFSGRLTHVFNFEYQGERIRRILIVSNPDKLAAFR